MRVCLSLSADYFLRLSTLWPLLFDWLWARHENGEVVLDITDPGLIMDLTWVGVDWDTLSDTSDEPYQHLSLLPPLLFEERDISIRQLREEGYFPQAVLHYLAMLGWEAPAEDAPLSLAQVKMQFTKEKLRSQPVVFKRSGLDMWNKLYLERQQAEYYHGFPTDSASWIENDWLDKASLSTEKIYCLLQAASQTVTTLAQLRETIIPFFQSPDWEQLAIPEPIAGKAMLSLVRTLSKILDREWPSYSTLMPALCAELDRTEQDIVGLLRTALTGASTGIDMAVYFRILGLAEWRRRWWRFQVALEEKEKASC